MTRKYQQYTQQFKLEAIRLMNEADQPTIQVARELGIRVNQLYKWKKQLEDKSTTAFSRTRKAPEVKDTIVADKDAEIKALNQKIERLEAEKGILKKAAAYFAKELN
jgi:transposase